MRRVLFVTAVLPTPPHGGERLRIRNLIAIMVANYDVALLCPPGELDESLSDELHSRYQLPVADSAFVEKCLALSFLLWPRRSWSLSLKRACQQFDPDLVWFDYRHWAQYVPIVKSLDRACVMGTHNAQASLSLKKAKLLAPRLRCLPVVIRYIQECLHEQFLFRRFDRIVSVSAADESYHAGIVGHSTKCVTIPNFVDERIYRPGCEVPRRHDYVVMTGNFRSFQNYYGATWFVDEVVHRLTAKYPDICVGFLGIGASGLFPYHTPPNTKVLDPVDDMAYELRSATIAVVPIFQGEGSRLKILEAFACETPVISTSVGAKGLLVTDDHLLFANSAPDFVEAIHVMLSRPSLRSRLTSNATRLLKKNYTLAANTEHVKRQVEELTGQTGPLRVDSDIPRNHRRGEI